MKEKHVDAFIRLHWYAEKEGGRITVPMGEFFAANLRFEKDETLWSVVLLFFNVNPDEMRNQVAGLGFLFHENLEEKLTLGKRVFIYEGPQKLIAEGEILSVND